MPQKSARDETSIPVSITTQEKITRTNKDAMMPSLKSHLFLSLIFTSTFVICLEHIRRGAFCCQEPQHFDQASSLEFHNASPVARCLASTRLLFWLFNHMLIVNLSPVSNYTNERAQQTNLLHLILRLRPQYPTVVLSRVCLQRFRTPHTTTSPTPTWEEPRRTSHERC